MKLKTMKHNFFLLLLSFLSALNLHANDANRVVQAHQWTEKSGSVSVQTGIAPDNTSIGANAAGDWVKYAAIDFGTGGYSRFMAYIGVSPANVGRSFEIRIDAPTGELLGTLTATTTGASTIFKEKYAVLTNVTGIHDVYLLFPQEGVANIDWFVFSKYTGVESVLERDIRMKWWREARFGRFIHWGGYAQLGGGWKGVQSPGLSEWVMMESKINRTDYELNATAPFNPINYDAKKWVTSCKTAGQKYMVLTSKHHEGFAMFENEVVGFKAVTDTTKLYDIVHFSKYSQDPMLSLAQECRSQGIKFGVYYSILDWHHASQQVIGNGDASTTMKAGQKDIYITQMREQLQELITKYDVELLWFDGEWSGWWTTSDGKALYNYLRSLKPSLIINNRIGKRASTDGDFGTPEGSIPSGGLGYDWESCMTMNGTWGYSTYANGWVSVKDQIRDLIEIASKGGNLLLNVGPDALGVAPQTSENILVQVGNWLKVYGASIYGTVHSDYQNVKFGRTTKKGTDYFLHVWQVDGTNTITFPMIADATMKPEAFLLKDSTKLEVKVTDKGLVINLKGVVRDPNSTVIVLKAKGTPYIGFLTPLANGSFVLNNSDVVVVGSSLQVEGTGNLGYWTEAGDYAYWNVEVPKDGKYVVTIRSATDNSAIGHRIAVQSEFSKSKVAFTSVGTGGWQTYKDYKLDTLVLKAGRQALKVGSDDGSGPWNNLMRVTLTPVTTTQLECVASDRFGMKIVKDPSSQNVQIRFNIPYELPVQMCVYNEMGMLVDELLNEVCKSGSNLVSWNSNVSEGVYFVHLFAENFRQTVKLII